MAKGKEKDVLYRVIKFEIFPTPEQIGILRRINDNLWIVWNEALEERQKIFAEFIAPLYERIKEAQADATKIAEIRQELREAYKVHNITFFDQVNALTPRRARDSSFAGVPRNWQEETLDTLNGSFSSFLALRKNGDYQARPPRLRSEWDFCEIPGRFGFKVLNKDGGLLVRLSWDELIFPIRGEGWQHTQLARATALKKFTLYRDERDMRKPGRFWISLAYEIPKPPEKQFVPTEAAYVALGASSIGVVSPKGEEVISLWRSDKHWKPEIDVLEERIKRCKPGSNVWRKRMKARRTMFQKMSAQQTQDHREVVLLDLIRRHGVHFVVTDLVVRSKKGKLADASDPERSGSLGLNWSAQNTGSIAHLVLWLTEKVREYGGTVRKYRLTGDLPEGIGHENKIPMAHALRDAFLRAQD